MINQQQDRGFSLIEIALSNFIRKSVWLVLKLGIPDLLVDGPKNVAELAKATKTHEQSLYRVLRVLSGIDIFRALPNREFALAEKGKLMLNKEDSMRSYLLYHTDLRMDTLTDQLLKCVEQGKPAPEIIYGINRFEYLRKNPELHKVYNQAMTSFSLKKGRAVAETYDFSGIKTLMDVGGGYGELMFAILEQNPHLKGIIFDQPSVIEGTKERIKRFGLENRCEAIGGDFFKEIPKGADAIIMAHILHDWDDENSIKILKQCKEALPKEGKVLLVESMLRPENDYFSYLALDIVMLVVEEGCERDEQKFRELYKEAGLEFSDVTPLGPGINIVEGRKSS